MLKIVRKLFVGGLLLISGVACAGTLDLNTADVAAIDAEMAGVGPAKAQAIVDYRTQHGLFMTLSDVEKVPGIGPKIIEANKDRIILSQPAPAAAGTGGK